MRTQHPWQMAVWANPVSGATVRVGDEEREQAARALGDHYAAGRLDRAEYDERLDQAFSARTRADLAALFRDLPEPRPGRSGHATRTAPPGRRRGRVPLLPLLLLLIGLAVLLDAGWIVWVGLGLWFLTRGGAGCMTRART
jgi:hypothetical protein